MTKPIPRLLHITDPHLLASSDDELWGWNTQAAFDAVLNAAKAEHWPADALVITGDLVDDETAAGYDRLVQQLSLLGIPTLLVVGNHDNLEHLNAAVKANTGHAGLIQAGGDLLLQKWCVLGLHTLVPGQTGGQVGETQLSQLSTRLRQHRDKHCLIALHHPPVSVQSNWLDNIELNDATEFWDCVNPHNNVKAAICGHVHQDFHVLLNGKAVYTTPSTWRQFPVAANSHCTENMAPGWRWLWLGEHGEISTTVRRLNNSS